MQTTKIALIQLAWNGSREGMMNQYRHLIPQAAQTGASLICLPEFSLTCYFAGTTDPSGFEWAEPRQGGFADQFFGELAQKHQITIVSSIFEKTEDGKYFDTAIFHNPQGEQFAYTRKVHIPSGEGYHETTFFKGYPDYPVTNIGTLQMAAPTCYDQWFPEVSRIYSLNGAEFIFYPTAIGSEPRDASIDNKDEWQIVMRGQAIANGIYIGAANRVGVENGVTFFGSSFVCDPRGRMLAEASRDQTEIITAELTPEGITDWREYFPLLHQRAPHTYGRLLDKTVLNSEPPTWLGEEPPAHEA